jgi:hypothetical protein
MATNRSELEVRVTGRDELSPQFDKLESRLIRFVGFIGASIAAIRISAAPIRFAADFERELANVRKTTNFTKTELQQLSKELLTMSTRVDIAATDLAKIAAAAGQQGLGRYGVEGVAAFTDSVSRMASVLDITAEQAADDVGKIVNIFKIPLKDIEDAVSTFNEVSNNSTAKGKELLDVVKRIGDELSVVAPERAALYAQKAAEHSRAVVASLGQQDNSTIYSMLIGGTYDGWHFEFGEFREASRGQVSITNEGVVSMPFQVSVVGSASRRQRIINMTLYFTMNYAGQLKTTGAL